MESHSQKRRKLHIDADKQAVSRFAELVGRSGNSVAPAEEAPPPPKAPPPQAFDPAMLAFLAEQARLTAAAEPEPPPPPPIPTAPEVSVSIQEAALAHASATQAAAAVAMQVSSKPVDGRGGHTATGPTRGTKRKSGDEAAPSSGTATAVERSATSRTSSTLAASATTTAASSTSTSATPAKTSAPSPAASNKPVAIGFALPFRPKFR